MDAVAELGRNPVRIGNLSRLIHTLLYVMTIHIYIHTVDPMLLLSGNPFKYHEEDFFCCL